MEFSWKVDSGPVNKMIRFWWRSRSRSGYCLLDLSLYWEIRKVVSTDCAARRCSAGHALAGIAIATMTSLRHHDRQPRHCWEIRKVVNRQTDSADGGTCIAILVRRKTCLGRGVHCPGPSASSLVSCLTFMVCFVFML